MTSPATLGNPLPGSVSPYNTITIAAPANATPPTFTLTATPYGSQAPDGVLTIDNTGVRTPATLW